MDFILNHESTGKFYEADSFTTAYLESRNSWFPFSNLFKYINWLVDWFGWLIECCPYARHWRRYNSENVYFNEENIFIAFWGFFFCKNDLYLFRPRGKVKRFFNLDVNKREFLNYFLDLVHTVEVMEILEDPEIESNSLKCSHYQFRIKIKKLSMSINYVNRFFTEVYHLCVWC